MKKQFLSLIAASLMAGATSQINAGNTVSVVIPVGIAAATHVAGALQIKAIPSCSLCGPVTFHEFNIRYLTRQPICANNQQVGYIDYSDSSKDGIWTRTISYFHVNVNMRNQGCGTQGLRQFIQQSEQEGVTYIQLGMVASKTENIYRRAGFIMTPEETLATLPLNPTNAYRPLYTRPTK